MRFGVNMFLTEEKWSLLGTFSGIFALVGGVLCVRNMWAEGSCGYFGGMMEVPERAEKRGDW